MFTLLLSLAAFAGQKTTTMHVRFDEEPLANKPSDIGVHSLEYNNVQNVHYIDKSGSAEIPLLYKDWTKTSEDTVKSPRNRNERNTNKKTNERRQLTMPPFGGRGAKNGQVDFWRLWGGRRDVPQKQLKHQIPRRFCIHGFSPSSFPSFHSSSSFSSSSFSYSSVSYSSFPSY